MADTDTNAMANLSPDAAELPPANEAVPSGLPEVAEVRLPEGISELRLVETREATLADDAARAPEHPGPGVGAPQMEHELPQGYGTTRLVLMVRDPYWLHAYWEIAQDVSEVVTSTLGPDGWRESSRVLRVHDVTDVEFDGSNAHRTIHIDVGHEACNWYINVDRPNRAYCAELGLVGPSGQFVLLSRSNVVRTPRAGVSEVIDEEWMTLSAIERYYPQPTRLPASPEMVSAVLERAAREMGSEFVSSISSPGMAQLQRRGFWLVASVEVVVHGATSPDASVTIQGRPVRLRPDGTFSARFAMPDGQQTVPIEASSGDGTMRRSITVRLSRETWQ